MARARMLSTDASIDPELNSISLESMTLYMLTLPWLDRDGLIDANPIRLSAQAAPLRTELRDRAGALINEWVEVGLVERYSIGRSQYALFFKGFRKHNQFEYQKDKPSRLPPPPGWVRTAVGLAPEDQDACFRLADYFHPENKYRKMLLSLAHGEDTSRSHLDTSRSPLDTSSLDQTRQDMYGGGGVHTNIPHTPGSGNGGDARGGTPTRLTVAFAELDDDELRIAANDVASLLNLNNEYNGWARLLSGATRNDLLLILAWSGRWSENTTDEHEQIKSYPALLRSKLRSNEWPGLSNMQIDTLRNLAEDAIYASVPDEER